MERPDRNATFVGSDVCRQYEFVTERYLEGTKRFHDVTNYFLVAQSLLFSLFAQGSKEQMAALVLFATSVGAVVSLAWLLILFRIEHMRDMRKAQGKQLETEILWRFALNLKLFQKEEYDEGRRKPGLAQWIGRHLVNLQVSHLTYAIPLAFFAAWVGFGLKFVTFP